MLKDKASDTLTINPRKAKAGINVELMGKITSEKRLKNDQYMNV